MQGNSKAFIENQWPKGISGNPSGRKKNLEALYIAIGEVETEQGKNLLTHAVQRAFKNDAVLIAILKKIIPDQVGNDNGNFARMLLVRASELILMEKSSGGNESG